MPQFGKKSKKALVQCHPLLQEVLLEAIKTVDFTLLDSYRGKDAQTSAYQTGHSKAKFGQSAHNYKPCVAIDFIPCPFKDSDWQNYDKFKKVADACFAACEVVKKRHNLPNLKIRWGGDWHQDGNKTINDQWDAGHIELHPWSNYITKT